jgi:hypothetical protein
LACFHASYSSHFPACCPSPHSTLTAPPPPRSPHRLVPDPPDGPSSPPLYWPLPRSQPAALHAGGDLGARATVDVAADAEAVGAGGDGADEGRDVFVELRAARAATPVGRRARTQPVQGVADRWLRGGGERQTRGREGGVVGRHGRAGRRGATLRVCVARTPKMRDCLYGGVCDNGGSRSACAMIPMSETTRTPVLQRPIHYAR